MNFHLHLACESFREHFLCRMRIPKVLNLILKSQEEGLSDIVRLSCSYIDPKSAKRFQNRKRLESLSMIPILLINGAKM